MRTLNCWGRLLVAYAAVLLWFLTSDASSQTAPSLEYRVKASFLYNLSKYVYWSSSNFQDASAPIELCVLGEDPFGKSLDEIQGQRVQDRVVVVERLEFPRDSKAMQSCHVLFLSSSLQGKISEIQGLLAHEPILTVSDISDWGIVTFVIKEEKVGLRINLRKAREANLQLSAHLLQLAEISER